LATLADQINTGNLAAILEFTGHHGHLFQANAKQIVKLAFISHKSIKPILEFTEQLGYAGHDLHVYEPLIQEMTTRNFLNGNDAVLLAVTMHHTMRKPSFASLPEGTKQKFALLKEQLPDNLQAIVAPRLRIKSPSCEYLLTDIFDQFDSLRRHVFVAKSKKCACDKFLWTIGTPKAFGEGFSLVNAWNDNMYAPIHFFDKGAKERRVFTWVPRTTDADAEWKIEPVGTGKKFLIKNVLRDECLCIQSGGKVEKGQRPVSTSKDCDSRCEWEFEAAEQKVSKDKSLSEDDKE
jgi:hypothetical protein